MPLPLAAVFADLPDPRRETANTRHALTDILTVAVCAVISGAGGWEQIAEYGRRKQAFFRRFLALPNGIPSHDTFCRVFCALDPAAFAAAFGRWMAAACDGTGLVPVAIDGKAVRGAVRGNATGCLCVVSAWATGNRPTLGQVAVPDGTGEVGVIPELPRTLDLAGAIVTLDAAGCQTGNAAIVRERGGHCLLAVKGNRPGLLAAVGRVFADACERDFVGVAADVSESADDAHGRREERYATVVYDPAGLPAGWTDAAAVVQVNRVREIGGERAESTHDCLTSHAGSADELAGFVRGHWGIESGLHWVLDVAFREDESRTRNLNGGANLALLRRVAVSLLQRAPGKGGIQIKRLTAAWDDEFLLAVLRGIPAENSA